MFTSIFVLLHQSIPIHMVTMSLLEKKEEEDHWSSPSMVASSEGTIESHRARGNPLHEDLIIFEILACLPVTSLFRFKSVCKFWNDLISQNLPFHECHFRKAGSSCYCSVKSLIISTDTICNQFKLSKTAARFLFEHGRCFHAPSSSPGFHGFCHKQSNEVFIYNPITNDATFIPNLKRPGYISLAYDPYNNPSFGFAIVFLILKQEDHTSLLSTFEVYSSKTREWRKSNVNLRIFSPYPFLVDVTGAYSKGKVYWPIALDMLCYNIEIDVATLVPCPFVSISLWKTQWYHKLGVCNGKGGELSYTMLTKEQHIETRLLRGDVEKEHEWEKRYIVRLPEIVLRNQKFMSEYFKPNKVWTRDAIAKKLADRKGTCPVPYVGGDEVWFVIKYKDSNAAWSFNMRTQELKKIHHNVPLTLEPFIPSLLLARHEANHTD